LNQEPRKPFYEGLLPDEESPVARQSPLQRSLERFARRLRRIFYILFQQRPTRRVVRVEPEDADIWATRRCYSGSARAKRSRSRKINVTLH
jgi:hypothetical protein